MKYSNPSCLLVLLLLAFIHVPQAFSDTPSPMPDGHASIRAKAGKSEIIITTTSRVAGAIHSLTWNGMEFIDSVDHGRQLQSASNFDNNTPYSDETFNPTEAGSSFDHVGDTSSSKLLFISAKENVLETKSLMAFWLRPGEKSLGNTAKNSTILSNHALHKKVTLGYKGNGHIIQYDVTFTIPADEKHTFAQFEALTGYMPPTFNRFYKYDTQKHALHAIDEGPGEQSMPVILATEAGSHAMAIYSPQQPSKGYETVGYGRWSFKAEQVNKWNTVFRSGRKNAAGEPIKPGDYSFKNFVIVGSLDDVKNAMKMLVEERK